jgi:hypothetical integral membrane protein (TIGR02206 family)
MPAGAGFTPFGLDHLLVLVLTGLAALGLALTGRPMGREEDAWVRRAMAAVLLGNEAAAFAVAAQHGAVRVPLQLCDLATGLCVWALLSLRPRVCELAFFWGLAGSLQAVLTPDLRQGFPDFWWLKFFLGHSLVVLSAVYLAATGRVAAGHAGVWRAWGWTNAYALAVGALNAAWGTNYGYLARKPSQPSLLDYFGPWPYYILVMEAAALASFYLYAGLLRLGPRRRRAAGR